MSQIPGEFILMFLGMVFIAVFLLSQGVVVPVFGEAGKMRKRIRGRLHVLEKANNQDGVATEIPDALIATGGHARAVALYGEPDPGDRAVRS